MAEWSRNKVDPSKINGGKEFTCNDDLTVAELNAMVNNSFFGVDFVEALAATPDTSEANNVGVPSVSIVDNGKFKKFKFSNLKGASGEQGNGIAYIEKGVSVGLVDGYLIHFDNGSTFEFSISNGQGIKSVQKTYTDRLTDYYTITFDDMSTFDFSIKNGRGISNISSIPTSTNGLVDTYTVNYNDGTTSTFKVTNGEKGDRGDVGATFSYDESTKTLTITT